MARTYNVIDADGHILEPVDIWDKYIDPAYRDRAPKMIIDTDGKERLLVEGKILGSPKGMGAIGGIGARDGKINEATMKYVEGRPGGFDPHARIPDMDLDGIDAAFLYPSIGLFSGAVQAARYSSYRVQLRRRTRVLPARQEDGEGRALLVDLERLLTAPLRPLDIARRGRSARSWRGPTRPGGTSRRSNVRRIRELVGHGECLMGILAAIRIPMSLLPPHVCERSSTTRSRGGGVFAAGPTGWPACTAISTRGTACSGRAPTSRCWTPTRGGGR